VRFLPEAPQAILRPGPDSRKVCPAKEPGFQGPAVMLKGIPIVELRSLRRFSAMFLISKTYSYRNASAGRIRDAE
jgi:hypothetical protein